MVKRPEYEEPEAVTHPDRSIIDKPPTPSVETSSQVKVTDLTSLLETRVETNASSQSAERPAEARRLRVAWPPSAGETRSGTTALSPVTEGASSSRLWRAKWPPEEEVTSSFHSSDRAELKSLRRSSSLKERSRPFTVAVKPKPATNLGPKEPRRPLKSLQEWRASFEEKNPSEEPCKERKPEAQQVNHQEKKENKMHKTQSTEAASTSESFSKTPHKQQEGKEQVNRENISAAAEKIVEEVSLKPSSPDISPPTSPPLQPKEKCTSQEVGFWEEDKGGSDAEELSAEDIIKKNRYYGETEDDSDS